MAIIIGDIHGCRLQLESLLKHLNPSTTETIVTLGDYVDRGPDTKGAIDFLIELKKTHNLIHLKGNHDVFMEEARAGGGPYDFWIHEDLGGQETLDSYGGNIANIPESHWEFLATAVLTHELDNHICVHGGIESLKPADQQDAEVVLNKRFHLAEPHISGKTIVCGHTRQVDGTVNDAGHTLCIDTNVFDGGYLTAFNTDTGEFHQTDSEGNCKQL